MSASVSHAPSNTPAGRVDLAVADHSPPRKRSSGRRVAGLFAAVATAGATAMLVILLIFAIESRGTASPDSFAPALAFGVMGAAFLMPFFLVPAFIGGAIWILFIEALGEDHWILYAIGGALIAGACTAAIFGLPLALPDTKGYGALPAIAHLVFMPAGAAGGAAYHWVARGGA